MKVALEFPEYNISILNDLGDQWTAPPNSPKGHFKLSFDQWVSERLIPSV
jgi:hypothetical protein